MRRAATWTLVVSMLATFCVDNMLLAQFEVKVVERTDASGFESAILALQKSRAALEAARAAIDVALLETDRALVTLHRATGHAQSIGDGSRLAGFDAARATGLDLLSALATTSVESARSLYRARVDAWSRWVRAVAAHRLSRWSDLALASGGKSTDSFAQSSATKPHAFSTGFPPIPGSVAARRASELGSQPVFAIAAERERVEAPARKTPLARAGAYGNSSESPPPLAIAPAPHEEPSDNTADALRERFADDDSETALGARPMPEPPSLAVSEPEPAVRPRVPSTAQPAVGRKTAPAPAARPGVTQ